MTTSMNKSDTDKEKASEKEANLDLKSDQNKTVENLLREISETSDVKKRQRLVGQLSNLKMTIQRSTFSGPLPPPSQLSQYEEILPGSADRILKMAENQALHRQNLETTVVKSNSRDSLLGVIFGFILGVMIIGGGIFLAIKGDSYGPWLTLAGATGLIGVFVYGTRSSRKERVEKDKARNEK